MSEKQCPRCKQYRIEEVPPTSVWEHLIPDGVEVHEFECQRCGYVWIIETVNASARGAGDER